MNSEDKPHFQKFFFFSREYLLLIYLMSYQLSVCEYDHLGFLYPYFLKLKLKNHNYSNLNVFSTSFT